MQKVLRVVGWFEKLYISVDGEHLNILFISVYYIYNIY